MLDTYSFLSLSQVGNHLLGKSSWYSSRGRDLLPEKAQHLRTGKTVDPQMQEFGVKSPQLFRVPKDDVHGPFALVGGPVIAGSKVSQDLGMQGIELSGDGIEQLRPTYFELLL